MSSSSPIAAKMGGYWVLTDEDDFNNRFLVFEREKLVYRGSFVINKKWRIEDES